MAEPKKPEKKLTAKQLEEIKKLDTAYKIGELKGIKLVEGELLDFQFENLYTGQQIRSMAVNRAEERAVKSATEREELKRLALKQLMD